MLFPMDFTCRDQTGFPNVTHLRAGGVLHQPQGRRDPPANRSTDTYRTTFTTLLGTPLPALFAVTTRYSSSTPRS